MIKMITLSFMMYFPGMGSVFFSSGASSAVATATNKRAMKARMLTEIKWSEKEDSALLVDQNRQ